MINKCAHAGAFQTYAGGVVDVNKDRLGEGGMTAMRLVEGGVAALGDDWLVEGPDGVTLILCFGQQESIRQYTIAFTHNNKKWIITIFCVFLSSGVKRFEFRLMEASTASLDYYRSMDLSPCLLVEPWSQFLLNGPFVLSF